MIIVRHDFETLFRSPQSAIGAHHLIEGKVLILRADQQVHRTVLLGRKRQWIELLKDRARTGIAGCKTPRSADQAL